MMPDIILEGGAEQACGKILKNDSQNHNKYFGKK